MSKTNEDGAYYKCLTCGKASQERLNEILLEFKKEILEEFKKEERQWHCRLCRKDLPSGAYCVERHFDKEHGVCGKDLDEHEQNWNNIYLDRVRIKKCVNRVHKRIRCRLNKKWNVVDE